MKEKATFRPVKFGPKPYILIFLSIFYAGLSFGQSDLRSLLLLAEENYPLIAARQAEAEAAQVNIALEKNTLLPSLDAAYQVNYSTYNNITGMSYPGTFLPISGPPSTDNFNNPVPGSAVSVLLKWSPLTFGQRSAAVEYNRKLYEKQLADIEDEVLRLKFRVAFLYLEMTTTKELMGVFRNNIERNEFNLTQVSSLVRAGLSPGVDSLRFKGELSKARTELFRYENLFETQVQELRELLVSDTFQDIEMHDFYMENLPSEPKILDDASVNPVLKMARFELEASQARLAQISRSWTPRLEFWGTTYARGSGIAFDGTVNKADGWSFSRYNYGVGVQLAFPILDIPNVKLRTNKQKAVVRSYENYFRQTQIALTKEEAVALGDLKTSLLIAAEVPVEYEASEAAFRAIQSRYAAGLIDYSDLIQAQYDLLNAEAGLKNAFISSWKSLLKLAVIRGDVNIFLNQIQN
ncbi:MAG: TolC family protein [Bacteroidales bacterium]